MRLCSDTAEKQQPERWAVGIFVKVQFLRRVEVSIQFHLPTPSVCIWQSGKPKSVSSWRVGNEPQYSDQLILQIGPLIVGCISCLQVWHKLLLWLRQATRDRSHKRGFDTQTRQAITICLISPKHLGFGLLFQRNSFRFLSDVLRPPNRRPFLVIISVWLEQTVYSRGWIKPQRQTTELIIMKTENTF